MHQQWRVTFLARGVPVFSCETSSVDEADAVRRVCASFPSFAEDFDVRTTFLDSY